MTFKNSSINQPASAPSTTERLCILTLHGTILSLLLLLVLLLGRNEVECDKATAHSRRTALFRCLHCLVSSRAQRTLLYVARMPGSDDLRRRQVASHQRTHQAAPKHTTILTPLYYKKTMLSQGNRAMQHGFANTRQLLSSIVI